MRRRVLITGSGGMLGIDLCQELGDDYELGGIDIIGNPGRAGLNLPYYRSCNISDAKNAAKAVADFRPDIIIHTAAWTDVDGCEGNKDKAYKVNAEGTKNIALACKDIDAVLIHISTDFVFDGTRSAPYSENDKANPLSVYGDSKLKSEKHVTDILKKYFIIRTSWLYGRNGKNFVDTILSKAGTEKVLKVVDDQVGSPTYTKDLAMAIHVLLKKIFSQYAIRNTQYGIYHVSNSGSVSWFDYAKEILRLAKLSSEVVPISSNELARPAKRPAMSVMDNSKFTRYTGYEMRNWKDALKDYLIANVI